MQKNLRWLMILSLFVTTLAITSTSRADHKNKTVVALNDVDKIVEVRDTSGQIVLTGGVLVVDSDDDDRDDDDDSFHVKLHSSFEDDADGTADIYIDRDDGVIEEQTIRLKVDDMPANSGFDLFIDGVKVNSFTTDGDGDAKMKISI
jgi:hypothetical protein